MTVSEYINDTFQAHIEYGCYFRLVNVAKFQIHSLDLSRSEAQASWIAILCRTAIKHSHGIYLSSSSHEIFLLVNSRYKALPCLTHACTDFCVQVLK